MAEGKRSMGQKVKSDLSHGVLSSSNRIDRAESDITADWNAANGLWGKRLEPRFASFSDHKYTSDMT
ncbi:unnamed protein product [Dracunculus medinensis]|uniref:Transposase n=1 Tax=Dracunculus medinensis TaxID=318479 RepID=A0A0N4U8L3_DRAME|nr:unnamed protein product [Dracunculus medinensis]